MTGRRAIGAALLVGAYAPMHRLLDPARTGLAGAATRDTADAAWGVGLYGSLIVAGAALALTIIVPTRRLGELVAAVGEGLTRPSRGAFAAGVGLTAAVLSLTIAMFVHAGLPTSVDEMAQLLHAQALATGRLTLPLVGDETAWSIQNGLFTPEGWASIYPPFHTLLLAAGLKLGAAWLIGPAAVGVATWASALSFETLLGPKVGRVAGLVLAFCPFWLLLGATHLSHTTAAACLALVLWTGLRARRDGLGWAVAAGAAAGAAVAARPWIGLVSAATLLLVLWWKERDRRAVRLACVAGGGLPFAGLLLWWNARLFGHPLRLGYSAAYGEAHALGFHIDPWGNAYGPLEAAAYTGADLMLLGTHLLETPLPAVALVGLALAVGMRCAGTGLFLAWVVAAIAANTLYWHHGVHMGPRMLYETVPAWVGLFVASAAYLTRGGPQRDRIRVASAWVVTAAGIGALMLLPGVISSATRTGDGLAFARPPDSPTDGPALVFVHGTWSSRVVARLSATGMRRDSVETALRRNDICDVDRYARWRAGAAANGGSPPLLDLDALPGRPPDLRPYQLSPGNVVWTKLGAVRDGPCAEEALADARGTVELEPLLWQRPPLPGREVVVARDMGPSVNASVREAMGSPRAFVYATVDGGESAPQLLDYGDGMELLWGRPVDAGAAR